VTDETCEEMVLKGKTGEAGQMVITGGTAKGNHQ